eukprot:Platyproteum_vivax@DN7372_c0_g1_i2.p1
MSHETPNKRARQPVRAIKQSTGEERIFESASAAAAALNMSQSNVSAVIAGRLEKTKGWMFERVGDESTSPPKRARESDKKKDRGSAAPKARAAVPREKQRVKAINDVTGEEREFDSTSLAASALGLSQSNVCSVLSGRLEKTKNWRFIRLDVIPMGLP